MLVLSRKKDEKIVLGDGQRLAIVDAEGRVVRILRGPVELMVIEIRGDKVRLGIEADPELLVDREEVALAKRAEASPRLVGAS